jgi:MFS family permease
MENRRNFTLVTIADAIARSAYQMGKTPLLPVFAASLGAGDLVLGLIVSVSTLAGMIFKPFFGLLSDRWGRRIWLIIGTIIFAGAPFLYHAVETPQHLLMIRIFHGFATAIYGPVTLAFVAEQTSPEKRPGGFGLFSVARSTGYIIGPAVAGWLLIRVEPVDVFAIIGLLSCLIFIPILLIPKTEAPTNAHRPPIRHQIRSALKSGSRTPAIWISGGLDATVYIALYALKAFLPIYGITLGMNIAQIGLFFSVQEGSSMVLKPFGGRLGNRWGAIETVSLGILLYGLTLPMLTWAPSFEVLLILAVLFGCAQALVFPSTKAIVSNQVEQRYLGAGMGLTGALNNTAKVIGPILGGFLVQGIGFVFTLQMMGLMLLVAAGLIWFWTKLLGRVSQDSRSPVFDLLNVKN